MKKNQQLTSSILAIIGIAQLDEARPIIRGSASNSF